MSIYLYMYLSIYVSLSLSLSIDLSIYLSLCLSIEPQIKRPPTNLTLLLESKALLTCGTLGNPKPDITWLKDDELIQVLLEILHLYYAYSSTPTLQLYYN